jgi:predicted Zn-dependent protease
MDRDLRVSRAHHFYISQDYKQTLSEISHLKKSNLYSPELSVLAANSFYKLDEVEAGNEELKSYRKLNPLSAPVNLALAQSYCDQKKFEDSRNILFEVIQNQSVDLKAAWTIVARTYFHESNWEQLVKLSRLTFEKTPEIDFLVGQAYYKKKDYYAARENFVSSFNHNFEKERSAEYLTYLNYSLNDLEASKKSLSSLLEINKQNNVAEKMFYRLILKESSFDKLSVLYLYDRTFSDTWVKNEIVATLNERGQGKEAIEYIANQKQIQNSGPWLNQVYSAALSKGQTPSVTTVRSPASKAHIVQKGDTLRLISLNYFGTKKRWEEIYRLNESEISNSNVLPVGLELKLPD